MHDILENTPFHHNLYWLSEPDQDANFERTYVRIRQCEGRVYSDDEVRNLPNILPQHPLANEWKIRAVSCEHLQRYLRQKFNLGNIQLLEIGCGNGWLASKLSRVMPHCHVLGLDINQMELAQAARVFGNVHRLRFAYGDFISLMAQFDVIVLASVAQYFVDFQATVSALMTKLKPSGEIHIIDSPFYKTTDVSRARARTQEYYTALGEANQAMHYHAHSLDIFREFCTKTLYNPHHFVNKIKRKLGVMSAIRPFYWFCVTKS
jgi:ubiquinone/menaquinone biosynthesis C-methylase UbiE